MNTRPLMEVVLCTMVICFLFLHWHSYYCDKPRPRPSRAEAEPKPGCRARGLDFLRPKPLEAGPCTTLRVRRYGSL